MQLEWDQESSLVHHAFCSDFGRPGVVFIGQYLLIKVVGLVPWWGSRKFENSVIIYSLSVHPSAEAILLDICECNFKHCTDF